MTADETTTTATEMVEAATSMTPASSEMVAVDSNKLVDSPSKENEISFEKDHSANGSERSNTNNNNNSNTSNINAKNNQSENNNRKSRMVHLNAEAHDVPIVELTLEHLFYKPVTTSIHVKNKNQGRSGSENRTTVLNNISTQIAPYQLTAWMGPSGSGKTSLTSVVAGLIADPHAIDGVIKVNGEEGRLPKRLVGVVWQDDLLLSNLTVCETIYFAARLKTPATVPDAKVKEVVEATMAELGLLHIRDNLIGSAMANLPGISGGERKRTAVAAELVVRPSLLVLDEPTSGLDATTARSLMATLKELAQLGHAIAVVIHQPRTDIYRMIDHLLLLSKGNVIFDGPACDARGYLESCPSVAPLPEETGIADWIMDTIIEDERRGKETTVGGEGPLLAAHWATANSTFVKKTTTKNSDGTTTTSTSCIDGTTTTPKPFFVKKSLMELEFMPTKFDASFTTQLRLLTGRTLKQRRGERITRVTMLLTLTFIFFTSLFWWRLPDNTSWTFQRNSLLFFMLIAQANSIVVSSMTVFQQERSLLRRERNKKMYAVLPYFLAKTASDLTNNVFLPLCYGIVVYFTTGLRLGIVPFLKFVLAFYLTLGGAQSMGFFLSVLIPTLQLSLILAPPITLFFLIIGGFYVPIANMPAGIQWASYLSFARYGYSALLINEFGGRDVPCADDGVPISIGGTADCPLPGEAVYDSIGIDGAFTHYWLNIAMVAVLQLFFLLAAYGLLRRSK
jgi:ABC-type multidrug transport system ATPase subunit/ABC-type multidrug transport system permease subunit